MILMFSTFLSMSMPMASSTLEEMRVIGTTVALVQVLESKDLHFDLKVSSLYV